MKGPLDVHPPLDGYDLLYVIGWGGFGLVKLAQHLASEEFVAVKILLQDASPSSPLSTQGEVDILRSLRHDNIVRLLEERHTRTHLFLVMELLTRGSLWSYVRQQGGLAEDCHGQCMAHRDLKLDNLLLDEHKNIKLADFGLSLQLEQGTLVSDAWGTPEYCGPEVFLGEDYEVFKADMWSLGVVLFAMLEATLPFGGKDLEELQDPVLCSTYVVPRGISPALQELLAWLLNIDASGRPSAEDARTHSWFGPSREAAQEHEEDAVTPLQPLGVPWDPEAREYLAGLGLLPGMGTEGTPGPQPQNPASLPESSQSSKRPPIEDNGLALVSHDSMAINVSSAWSDSFEAPGQPPQEWSPAPSATPNSSQVSSQPQQERSPAPSPAPDSSEPSSQPQQERSPAPSAAPEPASKASPSSPSARSCVDLAKPEAAAAAHEPEGAGTAATAATADATASAQGKRQGRRGVGRRILQFLLRACCILPSGGSSPGHCCCRKAPK